MVALKKKKVTKSNPRLNRITKHNQTIRGLKTSWLQAGSSRHSNLLIFLHGFPDDAYIWSEQLKHFSQNNFVIAPMLRGVANSEVPKDKSRYGLNAVALDILEILQSLDPQKKKTIHLIGHDLGTLYAWHLAPMLGKQLKHLVIINGGHPLQAWERRKNYRQLMKSWYIGLFQVPLLPEIILNTFGKKWLNSIQKKNALPLRYQTQSQKALEYTPNSVNQYREIAKGIIDYIRRKDHFRLDTPVLALSSAHDAFVEPTSYEELELFTTQPVVRIIEGKHWIQAEQPERVNQILEKFIHVKHQKE